MNTLTDKTPAAETERTHDDLMATVGQELRSPLATIKGSATTLLQAFHDMTPAEVRQFLRIVISNTDAMRTLIGDFLEPAQTNPEIPPFNPEGTHSTPLPPAETGPDTLPASPHDRVAGERRAERKKPRILVMDNDPQALNQIRETLRGAGYSAVLSGDPKELRLLMETQRPQLALLEVMFPETDGMELMRRIFEIDDVPVIFLSAYRQDQAIATALERGASDYILKPYSPIELVARLGAALRRRDRRRTPDPEDHYASGDLSVDYAERRVSVAGEAVRLTPIEYSLLQELSANAGRVLTHDTLLGRIWSPGNLGDVRPLRQAVKGLRRKLGDDAHNPRYIQSERGVGYRMPKPPAA